MLLVTQILCISIAFPDVCKVPAVPSPIPVPFVNISLSSVHIPIVINIFICGGMPHNLLTFGTTSNGDEPGALLGVAIPLVAGPNRYVLGSFKTFFGVALVARLGSMTAQNGGNALVGMVVSASQFKLLIIG